MGKESLAKLLKSWENHAQTANLKSQVHVQLFQTDQVRIKALAHTYKMSEEDVLCSLIHEALNELEAKMPYIPGDKVIRVEDGEEIYEDVGPMPDYLEAQKKVQTHLEKAS
jgi:hypothetical protein